MGQGCLAAPLRRSGRATFPPWRRMAEPADAPVHDREQRPGRDGTSSVSGAAAVGRRTIADTGSAGVMPDVARRVRQGKRDELTGSRGWPHPPPWRSAGTCAPARRNDCGIDADAILVIQSRRVCLNSSGRVHRGGRTLPFKGRAGWDGTASTLRFRSSRTVSRVSAHQFERHCTSSIYAFTLKVVCARSSQIASSVTLAASMAPLPPTHAFHWFASARFHST